MCQNSPVGIGDLRLTGISAIVSYFDRLDSFGAPLTFNNTYSFGVTSHCGDIGVFVSYDFADLYKNQISKTWGVKQPD